MPIRSGRFKSEDATGNGITIISGRKGAFYRILNSGHNDFTVVTGQNDTPLSPTMSLDVAVTTDIKIQTTSAVEIQGIYDYLNTDREIRSGRFNTTMAATDRHKIIDLTRGGAGPHKAAYYRILNAGEGPLELRIGAMATPVTLEPGQGFDFEITPTGNRDVFVNPTANGKIEGIYDFLGQE